nr:uncharacterized protein LOC121113879 [Lepeophtheirus salmonis]
MSGAGPIAYALREETKKEIDSLEENGVIEKAMEATDGVHPIIVIKKKNGGVRLCVDLRKLNEFVKRPYYPMKTRRQAIDGIPLDANFFTVADAAKGYFQSELEEKSR